MKQKTIGIVGGGQLGRMLIQSAKYLGLKTIVLDPTPKSPAGLIADKQIIGDFKDPKMIKKLAKMVDFLTFEIESANAQVLKEIQKNKTFVQPSPETLETIQDKLLQKLFLKKNKIKVADFEKIDRMEDFEKASKRFGYPLVLKARFHGYDGRGNVVVKSKKEIKGAFKKLQNQKLYAEKFVQFKKEIAVQAARNVKGEVKTYPVVETIQKNNICHIVKVPAEISDKAKKNALSLAKKTVLKLKGAGVFGIEMFLKENDEVLLNEIAPRVHNSGHYTIEASETSQFEQHVRAVSKMHLGPTRLKVKAAVMINILGDRNGLSKPEGVEKASQIDGVSVHIYDKLETRKDRKMGHLTAIDDSVSRALEKAQKARRLISI